VGVTGNDVTNHSRPWDRVLQLIPLLRTVGSCARAMADNRETKGFITPPPRWVSAQLLYVCVTA